MAYQGKRNGETYEVPRIYLKFIVEKTLDFARLMQSAVALREQFECKLKFSAVVDGMLLSEIPIPPTRLLERIRNLIPHHTENEIAGFEVEHIVVYQKAIAEMELLRFYKKEPRHIPPTIQLAELKTESKLISKRERWVTNGGETSSCRFCQLKQNQ